MECTVTVFDVELDVSFEISAYKPARIYGPVELCHPEEGGEISFESICMDGTDIYNLLADSVIEMIEQKCYAYAEEQAAADEADYYDMLREDREYNRLAA